ncbi:alpha/beta hydrolase [Pseudalkalibacillus hwajinpoensis]|uniref:alpha/beta fold hydrolase n=1 Tax=Guptibacillus hwajinpoensis TaxID=208199 RepID=UPI00325A4743
MPYLNLRNIMHYYEDEGSGLPLIFLHPPGMGHVVFHEQRMLSRYFRVIVYDMRGHGYTSKGQDPLSISLLGDDLKEFVDALEIPKAIFIGYSSGGSVVQDFAIKHQQRVAGIILCGGFSEVNDVLLDLEFRAGSTVAHNLKLLSWILAKSHAKTIAEFQYLKAYANKTDVESLKQFYEKGRVYSCTKKLSTLRVPFLHLSGERAFYFHHYQQIYKNMLPFARIIRVAGAFHELPTKSFREFNHIVRNFVTSIESNHQ